MRTSNLVLLWTVLWTASCGGHKTEFVPAPPPPRPAPPPPPPPPKPAPAPAKVVRKPAPPPKPVPPPDEMRAVEGDDRVYYDDATAFRDSVRLTITDQDSWKSTWLRATQAQATAPALPEVDFQKYMLLLVSAGRLKPGDEIHVDSVGLQHGRPVAVVRTTVDCKPFPGDAYPLEIVRMKRSDSTVTFIELRGKTEDC
jgi:hypothetical protein